MIKKFLQKAAAFVLCTVCFLAFAPDAAAAQLQGLPGQELWQPYLEKLRKVQSPLPKIRSNLCSRSCRDHRQR